MDMRDSRPIRVMIVDDSAVVRRFLAEALRERGFDVIAAVQDPVFALEFLQKDRPDVIVLDVEMPRMDGLTFLRQLMGSHPIPVVMCSTLTEKGAEITMQALAAGAVSVIAKPTLGLKDFLQDDDNGLVPALRSAAQARLKRSGVRPAEAIELPSLPALAPAQAPPTPFGTTQKIVVMGLSTGGVQSIEQVLPRLPRDAPGIVIVQHMPERFTASLATRLNGLCAVEVREAKNGDRVLPGTALIAPGGRHTRLKRNGAWYGVEVFDGPVVNHHRPSVDVLFRSAAQCAGRNAIGILMTGMGDDGARGLRDMHQSGAWTIAQDEASCVVFGMPKEAIKLGAASEVLPLQQIAPRLLQLGRPRDA